MRHIIDLVEARKTSFQLHPALDPSNYVITDSLSDVDSWKAMTYSANSGGKKGVMADVGYIMIGLSTNAIIPMSRNDEHHQGWDTIWDLIEKKRMDIDTDDFVSIWPHGTNYIYSPSETPKMLKALTKLLAYGGKDGILRGTNDMRNIAVTYSDFVKLKGKVVIKPGTLAPLGARIVEAYRALADKIALARNTDQRSVRAAAFVEALAVIRMHMSLMLTLYVGTSDRLKEMTKQVGEMKKNDDVQGLEELFFGFNSLKNEMHNALREFKRKTDKGERDYFNEDKMNSVWGDIGLAIDMLGRF